MAITLPAQYKTDRLMTEILTLQYDKQDIAINEGQILNTASFNDIVSKIYTNFYYCYSRTSMYRPILIGTAPLYPYVDTNFVTEYKSVPGMYTKDAICVKGATKTYQIVAYDEYVNIYDTTFNTNGTSSIVLHQSIRNLYNSQVFTTSFKGITAIKIYNNNLYILDDDNVYKIDITNILAYNTKDYKLVASTQGFKDTLLYDCANVNAADKAANYITNYDFDVNSNIICVLDKSISNTVLIKLFDTDLNYLNTVALKNTTNILDINIKDDEIYLIDNTNKQFIIYNKEYLLSYSTFNSSDTEYVTPTPTGYLPLNAQQHYYTIAFSTNFDSPVYYYIGDGSGTRTRLNRSFLSSSQSTIDSRQIKFNTTTYNTIRSLSVLSLQDKDIVTVTHNSTVINYIIPIIKVTMLQNEDFNIFGIDNASLSGEDFISPLNINKCLYKMLYDNLALAYNVKGQYMGVVVSNTSDNGVPEILYDGVQYPKTEVLKCPVTFENLNNYISINEVLSPKAVNRCLLIILELQKYIISLLQANIVYEYEVSVGLPEIN